VSILERDGRDPMLKLRPGGGVSACAAGDLAAARALAAAGWQAAHAVDKHGNTALMWAAGSGRLAVVRWLLEDEGVAVRPAGLRAPCWWYHCSPAWVPGAGPSRLRAALRTRDEAQGRAARPRPNGRLQPNGRRLQPNRRLRCGRETWPKSPILRPPSMPPSLRWARPTRMGAPRSCGRARTARCKW
jgi:hypothetical protein